MQQLVHHKLVDCVFGGEVKLQVHIILIIEFITIQTLGNAQDFGELTQQKKQSVLW